MEGAKKLFVISVIIVVGAVLGSALGWIVQQTFPAGVPIVDLFTKDISAGLVPTTIDLRILEMTFGFLIKLNLTSILGIILAAFFVRYVIK